MNNTSTSKGESVDSGKTLPSFDVTLSKAIDDKNNNSSSLSRPSSRPWSLRIGNTPWRNFITGRELSYGQYKFILWVVLIYTMFVAVLEIWSAIFCWGEDRRSIAVATLLAPVGFAMNCVLILRLIYYPKTYWALISASTTLLMTIVNVIVLGIYYSRHSSIGTTVLALNIMFCLVQVYVSNLLYRYWEFVKFNYDENWEATLREIAESRYSQQSSAVLSGLHSPQNSNASFVKAKTSRTSLKDVVGSGRPSSVRSLGSLGSSSNV